MDDRSPSAKAMSSVTQISTISMMTVVPALLGYFLDTWLGTKILFMFLGTVFGLVGGVWQLLKLVQGQDEKAAESVVNQEGEASDEGSHEL